MEATALAVEARVEETHWWFVGRRWLIKKTLARIGVSSPDARILDVGSGTGNNLRLLQELGFTDVQGLDASDESIRYCREKNLGTVQKGDVGHLPFDDGAFDCVLATDIIEHVDDDQGAISELRRILRPGGQAIITVPAFQSLWGLQDEVSHHKRRYRKKELLRKLEAAGLETRRSFYFNFILFVPIWLARQVLRIFRPKIESENQINTPFVNWILTGIFALDVRCARWLPVPFGVSILAVAVRNDGAE